MTNDVEALDSLVTDSVVTLFQAGLTLVGTVAILLFLDVKLALITFCVFPFVAAGSIWFRLVSAGAFRRTRETIGAITAYLQETLSGIRVVRSFGQEPRHEARFAELNADNRDANMVTVRLNAAYFPAVEMLSGVALAVIVLYGGYQAIEGHITAGTVVAFVGTLSFLFEPIQQLSQLYTTYQSGMAALEKIFQLLDVTPDMTDRPGAIPLERIRGEVRFEDVSFAYTQGRDGARAHRPDDPPRPDRRARRRDRRRQVDDRQARRALLRPDGRPGAGRRPRPARGLERLAALADGDRPPGGVPVLRHDRREHRLRPPRRRRGRDPRGRGGGRRRGVHRRAAARLRHRGRRARRAALRRPAPADRLRPRPDRRPAHPRARRGDLQRRPAHRGPDRGRPAPPARRAHGDRDRPPPLDDPPGRPDRRARRTAGSSSRAPTTS